LRACATLYSSKDCALEYLDVSFNDGIDTRLYLGLTSIRELFLAGLGLQQLESSVAAMKNLTRLDLHRYCSPGW